VVNTGSELILFDTGNGALRREHERLRGRVPDGDLVARLAQAGYQAEDIDVVASCKATTRRRADRGRQAGVLTRATCSARPSSISGSGEGARGAFDRGCSCRSRVLADRAASSPGDEIAPGIRSVDAVATCPA
jgi:hypothetical protein